MDWVALIFGSALLLINYYAEEYRKKDMEDFLPINATEYFLPRVENYDFIIVGGGVAGCVLANRLSENLYTRVLLLEAGGNPPPQTEIPAFAYESRFAKSIIYDYKSAPLKYANNTVTIAPVGKVLGGTSVLNLLWYNRGHPKCFDRWAQVTDDSSWKYENVLKYFKSIESYRGEFPVTDQHGTEGPMIVSRQSFAPGRPVWFAAGREMGYQIKDPNGPQQISFTPIEYTKVKGHRLNAYDALVKPIESKRYNLKVERYAEATKVLIDEKNGQRAYAVMYKRHGVYQAAYAKKEVIVSAGTFGSSQLLLKSGIGPSEVLQKANIKMVADLPVGRNLQDHSKLILKFFVQDKSVVFDPKTELNQRSISDFKYRGKGPLTSYQSLGGQAYVVSTVAVQSNESDWADLQLSLYSQNLYFLLPDSYENETAVYVYFYLARPNSRGWLTLNMTNIDSNPVIDYNFLSDPTDIKMIVDGIKITLNIFETTEAYKRVGASYPPKPHPACSHLPFRTDPYWECYVRNVVASGNHPAGTCRMGKLHDPNAVVDSKLRVIGIQSLRVVDASIMPFITNSNLQAAVYMIAEKAAAEIKTFWQPRKNEI